jgi:hypothetical protein
MSRHCNAEVYYRRWNVPGLRSVRPGVRHLEQVPITLIPPHPMWVCRQRLPNWQEWHGQLHFAAQQQQQQQQQQQVDLASTGTYQ